MELIPVSNSYLKPFIKKQFHLKIGSFYFFEDFVVVEYAEDTIISIEALEVMTKKSNYFFPKMKLFGLIVNKIHNYTTVPTDASKLEKKVPNLIATAVVSPDLVKAINFDLENHFFKTINRKQFSTLETAENWINKKIKDSKI